MTTTEWNMQIPFNTSLDMATNHHDQSDYFPGDE